MGEIKNLFVTSDWLEFELMTKVLVPPILKLKLRPMVESTPLHVLGFDGQAKGGYVMAQKVLETVVDWDLTLNGEPIPVTEENKQKALLQFLGCMVKGEGRNILGMEIAKFASDLENFVKN